MTTHTPIRCAYSGMVAQSGKIVLLNPGAYPSFSSYGNETWVWNGTNGNEDWTAITSSFINSNAPLGPNVPPGVVMSARINQAMALDNDGYVMVYGGQGSSSTAGVFQDTWTFNGTTWTLQSPATTPYGRYNAVAAFCDGYGSVMFGGRNANYLLNETWLWNGTTWSQIAVVNGTGPAGRTEHAMAGNPAAASVLLFGGQGTNSQFNDTWTFNGTAWSQVFPATVPSVRSGHCMAYDSVNGIWVMFGGMNEYNYLVETWTFNGTNWSQAPIANGAGPAGRVGAQMAFDTANGLTIMYGGIEAGSNYPSNATWSFNGATLTWVRR